MKFSKQVSAAICLLFLVSVAAPGVAQEKELNTRKGFLIGIGPALGGETNHIKRAAGGMAARIGGAFNERFQIYVEFLSLFTKKSGSDIYDFTMMPMLQYFVYDNFYAKAGGGWASADVTSPTNSNVYTTKNGYALDAGAGYEFRLTKSFVLAPEARFNYQRIDGLNYYIPYGYIHYGWYF